MAFYIFYGSIAIGTSNFALACYDDIAAIVNGNIKRVVVAIRDSIITYIPNFVSVGVVLYRMEIFIGRVFRNSGNNRLVVLIEDNGFGGICCIAIIRRCPDLAAGSIVF